jgi:hypothetical protein
MAAATAERPGTQIDDLARHQCSYTACYCEENTHRLIQRLVAAHPDVCAVFVSNTHGSVPIWQQRAGRAQDGFVLWDYHVFALARSPADSVADPAGADPAQAAAMPPLPAAPPCAAAGAPCMPWLVLDLDTILPFPCTFPQYVQEALLWSVVKLEECYQRCAPDPGGPCRGACDPHATPPPLLQAVPRGPSSRPAGALCL